jgi:hypothetical protein
VLPLIKRSSWRGCLAEFFQIGRAGGARQGNSGDRDRSEQPITAIFFSGSVVGLRALVHDESKVRTMSDRGVEAIAGDFLEPESLAPALEGVSALLLITPHHPEQVAQATNLGRWRSNRRCGPRRPNGGYHQ